jgi:integrase
MTDCSLPVPLLPLLGGNGEPSEGVAPQARASRALPVKGRTRADPVATYLAGLAPASRRTQRSVLRTLARLLGGEGAAPTSIAWERLEYRQLAALRAQLVASKSPATANHILCTLRRVFKECWRLELIDTERYLRLCDLDPVRGAAWPMGRALCNTEVRRLLEACRGDDRRATAARDAAIVALLFGSGLRRAEAGALELADWDPKRVEITVKAAKGARHRIAYPAPWAAEALEEWIDLRGRAPGPLLRACDAAGAVLERGLGGEAIRRRLRQRAQQAGLGPVRPHDGRRSYISALLEVTDLATTALAAGHKKTTSTIRYDRRPAARAAKAAGTLSLDAT